MKIGEVLFSEQQIQNRVSELAAYISKDYDNLVAIVILKGAMFFAADLLRYVSIPVEIDTLSLSSYGKRGAVSGAVQLVKDITIDIEGRNVLLVEDIVDTGKTIKYLQEIFRFRKPKSIKLCSFLSKPKRRKTIVTIDYLGFEIPDFFVVGYGLDYKENFRTLPYIAKALL